MQAIIDEKKAGANITAVVFWGITDGTSWRKDGCPLLFNSDYSVKDSYRAVASLIPESEWNPTEVEGTLTGDIDESGTVDLLDVITLQKYLLAQVELDSTQLTIADMNGDSTVDAFDLAALKFYVITV
jgi:endo-1,4-beta-xylanase